MIKYSVRTSELILYEIMHGKNFVSTMLNVFKLTTTKGYKSAADYVNKKYLNIYFCIETCKADKSYRKWVSKCEPRLFNKPTSHNASVGIAIFVFDAELITIRALKSIQNLIDSKSAISILTSHDQHNNVKEKLNNIDISFAEFDVNDKTISISRLNISDSDYILFTVPENITNTHTISSIAAYTETDQYSLIYCDHDKLTHGGKRRTPWFNQDFNTDTFYAQDFISDFFALKTNKLPASIAYKGRHTLYNLLLQTIINQSATKILHIPKILFHKEEKNTPDAEGKLKIFCDNIKDPNIDKITLEHGAHRLHWKISKPDTMVSIIIPTKDQIKLLSQCIQSIIEKTTYDNYEIIIINNNSETVEASNYFKSASANPKIKIFDYIHEFNFSAINNYAVKQSSGDILIFLNNDTEVITPDWIEELTSNALREDIGFVGAKLYYPDDTIQHAGVTLGVGGMASHSFKYLKRECHGFNKRLLTVHNTSAVTAACMAVKKSLFIKLGGFNEKSLKVNFNDTDICLRALEQGRRNLFTPFAELYHHESISRGFDRYGSKHMRYLSEVKYMKNKWKKIIAHDPCYSIHLTRKSEQFQVRDPKEYKYDIDC